MKLLTIAIVLSSLSVVSAQAATDYAKTKIRGTEMAILTDPPHVPPPITRKHATKVIVKLEVNEYEKEIAPGVRYTFWAFGKTVPGKFIRIRAGDEVEFHLSNHPSSKVPHNIDLHAVTGTGGGAAASFTAPGHTSVFNFKALNPGLYVYHCATAPVGMHVANGMYGLILVEPPGGMSKVDKEFYVMQGDFYTVGKNGQQGYQPFSMEKAVSEDADYVVFNGATNSLVGPSALKAKVGEIVRIFFGVGGPNLTSAFHVIGEVFDKVYPEGNTSTVYENVQTTSVPPGGSAIVEFKLDVPGTSILVDHAITRAFNKGALGMLKTTGKENKKIYSGKIADEVYLPEGGSIATTDAKPKLAVRSSSKKDRIANGKQLYQANCAACHGSQGQGIQNVFPPLAKADYLNKNYKRAIDAVLYGLSGKIKVNGVAYNSSMPALNLTDNELSDLLTFVYSSWGNSGKKVTPRDVARQRR